MDTPLRVAITGATSGLGLALLAEFRRRGARVAFVARHARTVAEVAEQHGAHGIVGDVSRQVDIHPIALQVTAELAAALETNVLGPFRLTRVLLGALTASAREGRGAVVLNVSSDAAVNAYARWGAYGASKAALRHMSAIWGEELSAEGVRFLSLDPGDMDTPLHAAAVPDADPATLKRPETAARELAAAVEAALAKEHA